VVLGLYLTFAKALNAAHSPTSLTAFALLVARGLILAY
jgi:hypothetical protein